MNYDSLIKGRKENIKESLFKNTMSETFSNLGRNMDFQIYGVKHTLTKMNPKAETQY